MTRDSHVLYRRPLPFVRYTPSGPDPLFLTRNLAYPVLMYGRRTPEGRTQDLGEGQILTSTIMVGCLGTTPGLLVPYFTGCATNGVSFIHEFCCRRRGGALRLLLPDTSPERFSDPRGPHPHVPRKHSDSPETPSSPPLRLGTR